MTVSTLNQISAYPIQIQTRLIPQTSEAQVSQDRISTLNRELYSAVSEAEFNRTQNTSSINPVSLSDEARHVITAVAGHNSRQQQIEIYMNVMHGSDSYQANTYDLSNLLEENRATPISLYA